MVVHGLWGCARLLGLCTDYGKLWNISGYLADRLQAAANP